MAYETLELNKEGSIATLTIKRREALNALNAQVIRELGECLTGLKSDKSVRCLIVTGYGEKAFVAGADIKEMADRAPNSGRELAETGQKVFQMIEDLGIPTIAAVNGFALGGGLELALACDFIIAAKTAKMGTPEVSLGLICGYGGTQRLARHVGKSLARFITLTGEIFTAEQMEKWGVVALTTDLADLLPTVKKFAEKIVSRSPVALRLSKKAVNQGSELNQLDGLKLEAQLFQEAFQSKDKIEGLKAFIEKRSPQFLGE